VEIRRKAAFYAVIGSGNKEIEKLIDLEQLEISDIFPKTCEYPYLLTYRQYIIFKMFSLVKNTNINSEHDNKIKNHTYLFNSLKVGDKNNPLVKDYKAISDIIKLS
jgi:hypothetical protein